MRAAMERGRKAEEEASSGKAADPESGAASAAGDVMPAPARVEGAPGSTEAREVGEPTRSPMRVEEKEAREGRNRPSSCSCGRRTHSSSAMRRGCPSSSRSHSRSNRCDSSRWRSRWRSSSGNSRNRSRCCRDHSSSRRRSQGRPRSGSCQRERWQLRTEARPCRRPAPWRRRRRPRLRCLPRGQGRT